MGLVAFDINCADRVFVHSVEIADEQREVLVEMALRLRRQRVAHDLKLFQVLRNGPDNPRLAHSLHVHCLVSTIVTQSAREKTGVSSLFNFMYFRSSTRRRPLLQFDLIVINGGTDEIY